MIEDNFGIKQGVKDPVGIKIWPISKETEDPEMNMTPERLRTESSSEGTAMSEPESNNKAVSLSSLHGSCFSTALWSPQFLFSWLDPEYPPCDDFCHGCFPLTFLNYSLSAFVFQISWIPSRILLFPSSLYFPPFVSASGTFHWYLNLGFILLKFLVSISV